MKKLMLVILAFLVTPMLFAQSTVKKPDIAISITGKFQSIEKHFIIDIFKNNDSINITFSVLDSVENAQLEGDTAFAANRAAIYGYIDSLGKMSQKTQEKVQKIIRKNQDYIDKHSVYQRGSIVLSTKDNSAYCNLLTTVAKASKDTLEQIERNKKLVKIDGVDIDFEISTKTETKTAHTHSPHPQTNPLLHELLTKTLAIGRERKVNILSRRYFANY